MSYNNLDSPDKGGITASRCHSQLEPPRFRFTGTSQFESPVKSPFNQPHFNHFNTLTVKDVAGIKDQTPFGFEPYEMPKIGVPEKVNGFAPTREKKPVGCFTVEKRVHGWIPTPGATVPHADWKEQFKNRGRFGKYKKMTFTDDVFKYEKDKMSPQKYDTKNFKVNKPQFNYQSKDLKDSSFTQEAKWHSGNTPHAKHNPNFALTSPKTYEKKIHKPNTTQNSWRVPKLDGPAPGDYDTITANFLTQKHRLSAPVKASSQRVSFTDKIAKLHAKDPGVGKYQDTDKGFNLTRWGTFDTVKGKQA